MTFSDLGTPLDPLGLGDLSPVVVLYDFDGPRLFCANSSVGLVLVYQCDEDDAAQRFLVVPITGDAVRALIAGRLPPRDALQSDRRWMVDVPFGAVTPANAFRLDADARLPERYLPAPGEALPVDVAPYLNGRHEAPRGGGVVVRKP